ncbi:response regulator transcription factor [Burkholderia thailandensis]|uniref:Bacterial regulatory, luxR family protein n=1 Tax=Burkholderia thailandensis TaxID=57975 RepID=A0AAW9CPB5_BURTH|nr:response regulator transcription factor [Burkholderia thailandensis]AHI66496.1 bacterial regulatory s, luxR family protein [Burkholderia thailandensis H0587]AIP66517.1 LuxR family transcriptional regulator [Burkholderia thailandensis]AOI54447.1 LuxR family transcriptional regulator [Burkholderia thailandensis]AOJ53425.1 LuxR family transcriptional regulator [Burkholderia thailandensis]AVR28450.1 DNA-binding response regulator [Burkholderia thailandensis]
MDSQQAIRVIIADDHPIVQFAVTDALNALPPFRVVSAASSGRELLETLKSQACDLIVTDFTMQQSLHDEDGFRLIARLRRLHPEIPIVVFTMLTNGGILNQLCQMGVAGIVGKDEDIGVLGQTCLRTLTCKHPCLSPGIATRLAEGGDTLPGQRNVSALTPKELEVVRLFAMGVSLTDIARQLNRSITTVATQKRSAMRKLHVATNADLVTYSHEQGLI